MALAGISHGGQNDTFNKVVACGQKAKPLLYAGPSKGWGIPAGAVETPTSNPVESMGAITEVLAQVAAIATLCGWSERVQFPSRTAG